MTRFVLLASLAAATVCFGQFDTATVLGTIQDPSGAAIVGGKITLENVNTGLPIVSRTNDAGSFEFINVSIGTYRVRAESSGFKTSVTDAFTVAVSARQRVDVTLSVGEMTQTVSVKDAAATLETDSSDRGQVINNLTIVNLPLNGRSYADLALLAPGVRKSFLAMDQSSSNYRDASFNVNGLRSALNNFQVDGVDNNTYATSNQGYSNQAVQLSPDAVSEFKVQTNNFSAEYGRAGGAIINVSVRSGTNDFHGAAWDYLRNTRLNAVGFFKPALGKPVFQQNQFGGALGGRIIKNKTFFFADYEGLRRTTRSLSFQTIPTLEQRNGIFKTASGAAMPVRNPYTGVIYSDGVVPKSEITPFAQKVFSQLVAPTTAAFANNYQALPRIPSVDNKGDVRLDHYFNSKLTGFFRYTQREFNQTDTPVIPLPVGSSDSNGNVNIVNKQGAGGLTYTMSPTSLIEFRLGITRSIGGKWPVQIGLPNMQDGYGIPGLPTDPELTGGLNTQSISGYAGLGRRSSTPQFQNPLVIDPKVNYSKVFTRHTLKLGWEFQTIHTEVLDFSPQYGQDSYSGQFSAAPGAAANNIYNIADFLFGARSAYELTNTFVAQYRQRMSFYYLQDDWRVNSKLTLNLGVRYEYGTPQFEDGNHLANFDPIQKKLVQAADGDMLQRSLVNPDKNNWGPRVGLAYRVTPRTVIRSGYGVSYIHFNRLGGENLLVYNPPFVIDVAITNPDPSRAATCAPGVASTGCFRPTALGYTANQINPATFDISNTQLRYIPTDLRSGYVQSWHFTVQRELSRDLVLDLAYVGNRGVKLMILGDANQARPQGINENTALNARRPYQGFAGIEEAWGAGFSDYNSLQVKLEKKYTSGLYLLNSFTWSKALDNAAGHLETANGDNSRVNYYDLRNEKGLGSYNQPFSNTTTVVWDLPYGKGRRFGSNANPLVSAVIGNWRASFINTMSSGLPVNLTYGPASRFTVSSLPSYRPNLNGDPMAPESQRNIDNYFDKNNVVVIGDPEHPNPFGNAGRNVARSYALYQTDLGLHKDFPLWKETRKLEFRSEFFNLFNKTNFQGPNSTRSSAAFGTIRSAFPARIIQFALKLVF
ncbi:MAG TPA: TonB-dependent receptor [Bryobacteraceae bacterium]|nr:TonB-dependent receptor [Bryobacteraceae bacterium]